MATHSAQRLSWEQALAWRMERHHLVERAAASDLVRVVGEICGLHAQLMSSAELSLWARIDGLERDAVHETLWKHRALVKLWALGTQTKYGNTGHPEIDVLADAVGRALDGRLLTREELALEIERLTGAQSFGEWVRFSWSSYLKAASCRGLICFAPGDGGRVRFTTPTTCVPEIDKPDSEDALREVTRRFFGAYAPLTVEDLALWWGGYGPARGRRLLAALGEEAVEVDLGGERCWALARDVPGIASAASPGASRLLPAFDPWVIGATRRAAAVLEPTHRARVYRGQGWISPVLLVNGRMVGVWRHARKGQRLLVEIEPFGSCPPGPARSSRPRRSASHTFSIANSSFTPPERGFARWAEPNVAQGDDLRSDAIQFQPCSSSSRTSSTATCQMRSRSSAGRSQRPPKEPSPIA